MNLSKNVKKYFVNALKGIGFVSSLPNNNLVQELSEVEISYYLDRSTTTFETIFQDISKSVKNQLNKDEQSGDKNLQKFTAFNLKTTELFFNENQFVPGQKKIDDKFISSVFGISDSNIEIATRTIIEQLITGVKEQKYLTKQEKEEVSNFWTNIRDSEYLADKNPNKPKSSEDYYSQKAINNMKEKIKNDMMNGNQQETDKFLKTIIDNDARIYLEANVVLLKHSESICIKQGRDPETELQVGDVVLALSQDCQIKQVVTYFQERSQEQRVIERKNNQKEVTKENKIGNLIGRESRKKLAKVNGGLAVYADENKLKSGKQIWRGYKPLYDRIEGFLKNIYRSVQAIGFSEKVMIRKGFLKSIRKKSKGNDDQLPDYTQFWQADIETEIPQEYLNNNSKPMDYAGEFYHETKARLLADKMRLQRLYAEIADLQLSDDDTQDLAQEVTFLEGRIERASRGIEKLQNARTRNDFSDPETQKVFTSKIEDYILDDKLAQAQVQNQDDEQIQEDAGEQVQEQTQEEQEPIRATKLFTKEEAIHKSANDDMIDALNELKAVGNATTVNQRRAKINMAKELFGQHDDRFNDSQLEGMVDRFLSSKECDCLINQLSACSQSGLDKKAASGECEINGRIYCNERLKSEDYTLRAVDANLEIKNFVVDDIQKNISVAEFHKYNIDEKRSEIIQGM